MRLEEYGKLARQTENVDYDGIQERLRNPLVVSKLLSLFEGFAAVAQELDVLKKHVFYGKEVDQKELFTECLREHLGALQRVEDPEPDQERCRLLHGVLGMATEVGEAVEALIPYFFNDEEMDWVNLGEEVLGDTPWYQIGIIADMIEQKTGNNVEAWLQKNIQKLEKRNKGKKFNAESTINRNTEEERKILEQ